MSTQTASKPVDILLVKDNPGDVRLFRENRMAYSDALKSRPNCRGNVPCEETGRK